MVIIHPSIENVYSPAGSVPLPSHLNSCTPTKFNIYLDSYLETVIREPARRLCRLSLESVQVRGSVNYFVSSSILW
jgi:hypothetical protein